MIAMLNTSEKLYTPHLISVVDYQKMAQIGILSRDARVELIEGEIVDMAPIGSKHAAYVTRLTRELLHAVGYDAIVFVQNPIILGDLSEPEPDLALLKPKANDYEDALPQAEDILLLIEVADSTIDYDRQIKAPLYAHFSIPEYWLINIEERSIILFQKPIQRQFTSITTLPLPASLSPILLPQIQIALK